MSGTLLARFEAKVQRTDTCWLWTARKNADGYGEIIVDGRKDRAHRVSYRLFIGEIPAGLKVLHSCDTPACVNPAHLSVGTDLDNTHDKQARGRVSRLKGESNPRAKLTAEQVRAIRSDERTLVAIAADYGVSFSMISQIKRRESWREIE